MHVALYIITTLFLSSHGMQRAHTSLLYTLVLTLVRLVNLHTIFDLHPLKQRRPRGGKCVLRWSVHSTGPRMLRLLSVRVHPVRRGRCLRPQLR